MSDPAPSSNPRSFNILSAIIVFLYGAGVAAVHQGLIPFDKLNWVLWGGAVLQLAQALLPAIYGRAPVPQNLAETVASVASKAGPAVVVGLLLLGSGGVARAEPLLSQPLTLADVSLQAREQAPVLGFHLALVPPLDTPRDVGASTPPRAEVPVTSSPPPAAAAPESPPPKALDPQQAIAKGAASPVVGDCSRCIGGIASYWKSPQGGWTIAGIALGSLMQFGLTVGLPYVAPPAAGATP